MMKKNTIELMSANTENLEKILGNAQEKDNLSDRVALIEEVTDETYVLKAIDASGNLLIGFKASDGTCDITSGMSNGTYEVLMAVYEKMNEIAQAIKELKN